MDAARIDATHSQLWRIKKSGLPPCDKRLNTIHSAQNADKRRPWRRNKLVKTGLIGRENATDCA